MSPTEDFGRIAEAVRTQAADWFARMRGPDADAARASFRAWYDDPDNAKAYDQLVARWEQSAFVGGTASGRERRLGRAPFIVRHPALAAAAALVAVAGASLLGMAEFRSGPARVASASESGTRRLETGAGLQAVALSDGSHVTLDRASLILVDYSPQRRLLRLERGRARFDVAHDPARPFIVDAGSSEVAAHGTLFDVALRGEAATVTLLRGSISVRARRPGAPERMLVAGQQILVADQIALPRPAQAPADADAWLPRMIEFDDTPLKQAAAQVEHDAAAQIICKDDTATLRITGAFKAGDVAALAHAAAAMFDLTLERQPSGNFILSRPSHPASKKVGG